MPGRPCCCKPPPEGIPCGPTTCASSYQVDLSGIGVCPIEDFCADNPGVCVGLNGGYGLGPDEEFVIGPNDTVEQCRLGPLCEKGWKHELGKTFCRSDAFGLYYFCSLHLYIALVGTNQGTPVVMLAFDALETEETACVDLGFGQSQQFTWRDPNQRFDLANCRTADLTVPICLPSTEGCESFGFGDPCDFSNSFARVRGQ